MASFSSSVINKSGRKFAPKVPVRRGGPGQSSTPAPARKPGADARPSSQPPSQPPSQTAPEASSNPLDPPPPAPPPESAEAPRQPSPKPTTQEPQAPQAPQAPKQTSPPARHPIPIPVRRPQQQSYISAPQSTDGATLIRPPASSSTVARPPSHSGSSEVSKGQRADQGSDVHTDSNVEHGVQRNGTYVGSSGPTNDRPEVSLGSRPTKRIRVEEPVPDSSARGVEKQQSRTQPSSSDHPNPPSATQKAGSKKKSASGNKDGKPHAKRKKPTGEATSEGGADVGQEKKPRARRKRQATPENAESTEIVSTVVKMSDLCKDTGIGKKSKRETELRSMDWADVSRKRKERDERRKKENSGERRNGSVDNLTTPAPAEQVSAPAAGPQMKIVNGEIVLDTSSLQIDRHAEAAKDMGDLEEVEENPLTRKINSSSFGKRTKTETWDQELTDLFYRGLRMFGTDFMMISKMFPGRTRRHIKLKFSNEERRNPERIKDTLLGPREPVTLEAYSDMTNTVYDDPRAIEEELEQEKRKIEEQHTKEKEAREELLRNPNADSDVLPSIETGGNTKRRQTDHRKKVPNATPAGGTEEVLGTIDD